MVIAKCPQAVLDGWAVALTDCTVTLAPVTDSHTARSQTLVVAAAPAGVVGLAWAGSTATVASVSSATDRHNQRIWSSLLGRRVAWSYAERDRQPGDVGTTVAGATGGTLEERWRNAE